MASKFHADILNQPEQWQACLDHCFGAGMPAILLAAQQIKQARRVVVSGIGASYSAGLALEGLLKTAGVSVVLEDSSELMQQFICAEDDVLLLLSRSGKSVELLRVMELAQARGATIISICNDAESPLAKGSNVTLLMGVRFDHAISVSTYSAIILLGIVLGHYCGPQPAHEFPSRARGAVSAIGSWLESGLDTSRLERWAKPDHYYYFLARGIARSAAQEAALLWEEGAKMPAVFKTTGSFRHGPQEVVTAQLSVIIWLDNASASFAYDLALAKDLKSLGAGVLLVGLHDDTALALETITLPPLTAPFQILAQQLPAQLAAFYLATKKGSDADIFKYCSYIVNKEGGIW